MVTPLTPRFILPRYKPGKRRLSEQEARFAYTSVLNTTNLYYSVDTPTEQTYSFSGEGSRSAASDLSIYGATAQHDGIGLEKIANIELQAHDPEQSEVDKDIEKLIREPVTGIWFHSFMRAKSDTLMTLFNKFRTAFNGLQNEAKEAVGSKIVFAICIKEQGWSISKTMTIPKSNKFGPYISGFFNFDYTIQSRSPVIEYENGWDLSKRQRT